MSVSSNPFKFWTYIIMILLNELAFRQEKGPLTQIFL